MTPASWLFVREGQSIWIVRPHGRSLIVSGPGKEGARHDFSNEEELQAYQISIAEQLSNSGWLLSAIDKDRRAGPDRRAYPRERQDRRRTERSSATR